ncbi:DinB family protein [Reichenbachiella versicolor]|uniref:DinB family protein n=1 Tax=Reichenbachiella versicolor TaxID=1821036 RepID=UPI000D6E7162|nr:DinB family protein [Reichenbachiella versicolor]
MNRQELIDQLIQDTLEVKAAVKEFSELPLSVLSKQPAEDHWSVLQCVEHLNIADEHYLLQFEDKLPAAPKSSIETFKSGMLGKKFIKMIKPTESGDIPSPMQTFKKFRPQVDVKMDTVEKFLADQDRIVEYLKVASSLDINKNRIPSAIGSIIMFKLGDAFGFLIGHNQRHVQQMRNVLKEINADVELAS